MPSIKIILSQYGNQLKRSDLNYFIFLGDNVYGDTPSGSLRKMKSAYDKQKSFARFFK